MRNEKQMSNKYIKRLQYGRSTNRRILLVICMVLSMMFLPFVYQSTNTEVQAQSEFLPTNVGDSLALVAMYHAMNGPSWHDQGGWLQEGVPVPLWAGIDRTVEREGELRVTRMRLPAGNPTVPGFLPPEIGNLDMDRFQVSQQMLTGPIPPEISNWTNNFSIYLNSNYLSGEVPWEYYYPTGISRLNVNGNNFTGQVAEEIGDSLELTFFYMANNYLTGQIPESVSRMETLERIDWAGNLFTGQIPDLSGLPELRRVEIDNNPFEPGPFPAWLGDLASDRVNYMFLDNTNRTGPIPDYFANMPALQRLSIGGEFDEIEGDFSNMASMEFLPGFIRFYIHGGNLTGSIPDWIFGSGIQILSINNIPITGNIPDGFGAMESLSELTISGTQLSGPLPDALGQSQSIRRIDFSDNPGLTGGVPEAYQHLASLNRLTLSNNAGMEIGSIPAWISQLSELTRLDLSGSGVTGTIPDLNLPELTHLNLAHSEINGDVPAWIQQNVEMQSLDLSFTNLNISSIPDWLMSWTELTSLSLRGLGLTDGIPEWFNPATFPELGAVRLDTNQITGAIPSSWGDFDKLSTLSLSHNLLEGEIPAHLANAGRIHNTEFSNLQTVRLGDNPGLTGFLPEGFSRTDQMLVFEYANTGLCAPGEDFLNWVENGIAEYAQLYYPPAEYSVSVNIDGCNDLETGVESEERAYTFRLYHNYPNPFNPATNIRFEIPEDLHVSLKVYNVLGQLVSTLIDETKSVGNHEIIFDASNMSSGTYIYRLEAGNRVQTRTMMLVK